MSSGLYSTKKREFDTTSDLTKLKPYEDTMNDGGFRHCARRWRCCARSAAG